MGVLSKQEMIKDGNPENEQLPLHGSELLTEPLHSFNFGKFLEYSSNYTEEFSTRCFK